MSAATLAQGGAGTLADVQGLGFNEFSSGFTVSFSLFKMSLIIKVK